MIKNRDELCQRMAQALIEIEDECRMRRPAVRRVGKIKAILESLEVDLPGTVLPWKPSEKCAKCRDAKKWSPPEDVNGDGVLWHWCLDGVSPEDVKRGYTTALAKKCMAQKRS